MIILELEPTGKRFVLKNNTEDHNPEVNDFIQRMLLNDAKRHLGITTSSMNDIEETQKYLEEIKKG